MAYSKVEGNVLPSISKKCFCFRLKKKKKSTQEGMNLPCFMTVQALKGVHLDPLKSLNGQIEHEFFSPIVFQKCFWYFRSLL